MRDGLSHGRCFEPHFILEDMKHFGRAVYRMRARGKDIRFPLLQGLEDAPYIMIEPFGESSGISIRKESSQIRWLRRITPEKFDRVFALEDTRDFVTSEEDGDLAWSSG